MKEFTTIINAQITTIVKGSTTEEELMAATPEMLAASLREELGVDDVVVTDYKVFMREDADESKTD